MHDHGIEIHFFTRNHDIWMFDYLTEEIGAMIHRGTFTDQNWRESFYLAHGDGLGDHTFLFQLLRLVFRNRLCRFLFACLPTRWGIGCAHLRLRYNRKKKHSGSSLYSRENKEQLVIYAKSYLKQYPSIDFFIFGHRHILLDLFST